MAINVPVTKGVYRISRRPQYVGEILIYVSIGITCLSWVFPLAFLVLIVEHKLVTVEERICLKQYGDAYREYMNKTPRWIGIQKSRESDQTPGFPYLCFFEQLTKF